jgi:hypothetical protein
MKNKRSAARSLFDSTTTPQAPSGFVRAGFFRAVKLNLQDHGSRRARKCPRFCPISHSPQKSKSLKPLWLKALRVVAGVGFECVQVAAFQWVAFVSVLGFTRFFHAHGFPGISYGSRFEQQREGILSPFVT